MLNIFMTNFFEQFPEFVSEDSRKDRGFAPITFETLTNRHEVSLPAWLVKDKTILDLGSCMGATGHWCLSQGAKHYTGVEVQPAMVAKSKELLQQYWTEDTYTIVQQDIISFLDEINAIDVKYDVVIMFGVIYAFLDVYTVIKKTALASKEFVVMDCSYPYNISNPNFPVMVLNKLQNINSSDANTAYVGLGCSISPQAMRMMMGTMGFKDAEGTLIPKPVSDKSVHDTYITLLERTNFKLPARYMLRFMKTGKPTAKVVADVVISADKSSTTEMPAAPANVIETPSWVFDEAVANRFQHEAENHIPDYYRVINLCQLYVNKIYGDRKDIRIIDVGSALGYTLDKFINNGYTQVWGVDNSPAMINASKYPSRVINSSTMPSGPWHVVLANWTLHFLEDQESYLRSIFDSLTENGILILSNKTEHSLETEELYHDFKRANGVSEDEIARKKQSLVGVMKLKPLSWYLETLPAIGFTNVEVVNTNLMFSTIYASKR